MQFTIIGLNKKSSMYPAQKMIIAKNNNNNKNTTNRAYKWRIYKSSMRKKGIKIIIIINESETICISIWYITITIIIT